MQNNLNATTELINTFIEVKHNKGLTNLSQAISKDIIFYLV